MRKDFSTKDILTQEPKPKKVRWRFLLSFLLTLVISVVMLYYLDKKNPSTHSMPLFLTKLFPTKIWQKKPAPDQVASLNFEFYTALPDARVPDENPQPEVVVNKSDKPMLIVLNNQKTSKKLSPAHSVPAQPVVKANRVNNSSATIVSSDELQNELAKEFQRQLYVIQLGDFHTVSAAEKYHLALASAGIHTTVKKISATSYRVEYGPYPSKEAVKLAEEKLRARGITGTVTKIS